ncbi:hypothetical protein C0995_010089 [Termitomyces sp. Mi166|nr:hypothetical protein C0995_010089 [Termitomyces sp. Mi166\
MTVFFSCLPPLNIALMVIQRKFAPLLALAAAFLLSESTAAVNTFGMRDDLHFSLEARSNNKDGSVPVYKDPNVSIEDRVNDLLPRMTLEEKVSQLYEEMIRFKGGSIWVGYLTPYDKLVYAINVGQHYLMENTTLGIPALFQSKVSPHPSTPSSYPKLLASPQMTEGPGINHMFAPVLDLSRELRWGCVEEKFLTGEMGHAFVTGMQSGRRRNTSDTAIARVAATCKHFAAFGSPQGGL